MSGKEFQEKLLEMLRQLYLAGVDFNWGPDVTDVQLLPTFDKAVDLFLDYYIQED